MTRYLMCPGVVLLDIFKSCCCCSSIACFCLQWLSIACLERDGRSSTAIFIMAGFSPIVKWEVEGTSTSDEYSTNPLSMSNLLTHLPLLCAELSPKRSEPFSRMIWYDACKIALQSFDFVVRIDWLNGGRLMGDYIMCVKGRGGEWEYTLYCYHSASL